MANITVSNASGVFQVIDGVDTYVFVASTNVIVNLLDNTGNTLAVDLDNPLVGNITLNLGTGNRATNFVGSANNIGGNLVINAGSGNQIVQLCVNTPIVVSGSSTINLGSGLDDVLDCRPDELCVPIVATDSQSKALICL